MLGLRILSDSLGIHRGIVTQNYGVVVTLVKLIRWCLSSVRKCWEWRWERGGAGWAAESAVSALGLDSGDH